jgi:hypothetical protein
MSPQIIEKIKKNMTSIGLNDGIMNEDQEFQKN